MILHGQPDGLFVSADQSHSYVSLPALGIGMLCCVGHEFGEQQGDADGAIRRDRYRPSRLVFDLTLRSQSREVLADVGKLRGKVNGTNISGAVEALVDAGHGCYPAGGLLQALRKLGVLRRRCLKAEHAGNKL